MMKLFSKSCSISLMALCLFLNAKIYSQTISTNLFGQNAWMPDTIGSAIYNGKLHQNWNKVKNSGTTVIRFGGISTDKNQPTNYQYIRMIDSIRANGMEPIIQVPFNNYQYSAQNAANIVQYINITKGKNIVYFSIGNEPDLKYGFTSASQVAAYIKSFASAMKAVDPSIKILGPDCAWFNKTIYDGLTTPGGASDITGKDGAGRYYVDYITYHTYPFNGSQTRTQVISKLTQAGSYQDNLAYLKSRLNSCNTYHNRTGSSILKLGVTEANISYQNASGDGLYGVGTNSFIGGQFIAEMLCIGMKQGLDIFNMWSVIEGSSGGTTNIGYIDPSNGNKKPSYYHLKLVADNFKGSYANGTTNITNVKAFGSSNSQEICVLLMNQELTANLNYTLRLNTGTVSGSNPLKININASLAQEYNDVIQNQSTVLLTFNSSGTLIKKCEYSLSGNAAANIPPTCTPLVSDAPPTVTTYSPSDNATNVLKTANPVLTFSEPVLKGSGNIIIKENGVVAQTIAVSGPEVTISGNTATINPTDFSYSASVNIEMTAGVFKDSANNNYAGITDATTWNFTIEAAPDAAPPTVTTYSPSDNATNVLKTENPVLTFSEPVLKGSGNIIIKENGVVAQTIAVSGPEVTISGNTATINSTDFLYSASVNIEMAAGVFKDSANNNYAGITDATTWNFTIEAAPDAAPPTVTTYSPSDNATNVLKTENPVLTFSEPVLKGSGNIVIKENGVVAQTISVSGPEVTISGNTATINSTDFLYSASVNIEIAAGVFKDSANNNYAGIADATTWNFTIEAAPDAAPPTVTTYSPSNNATNVLKTANPVLTFSEPVLKGSGNIIIKENGVVAQTIAVSGPEVTISGNTATINSTDFSYNASVNIEMAVGVFKDSANNNYAGIADATTWNFTIEAAPDVTPPIVTTYFPADNSTNIFNNTNLGITFNEPIIKGSGNIIIKESGNIKQTIAVSDSNVTISGNTVTINPADFTGNSWVNIEMGPGVFKDLANNDYAGIITAATWNFKIRKHFVSVLFDPAIKGKGVSAAAYLSLTFNEDAKKGSGKIVIKENGKIKQTIDVSDPNVSISGKTITIIPEKFSDNASISVEISEGAFLNLSDEKPEIDDSSKWNFEIAANTEESENSIGEEAGNFGITVFPNPSMGKLTVEINNPSTEEKSIEIINVAGQEVYRSISSFSNGKEEIELGQSVSNGIYIVRVKNGDNTVTRKIVLER